jgi:hypothetical protein
LKLLRKSDYSLNGYGGLSWALKEAELSDNIEKRKGQLEKGK